MAAPGADFRVGDSHGYVLGRGRHLATARLSLQHFLWQRILQFTIHSAVQLPATPRIADVAAGTALWALEVAHARPEAQIDGYDIDITQAPVAAWRPRNLDMRTWDIFADAPADLTGCYDLVHVRLLVLVLSGSDPAPFLRRLFALLKPGAWLQWEDLDITRMHVKRADPSRPAPALEAIIEMSKSGGRHDWLVQLPELLVAAGFEDAQIQLNDDPLELCRAINDQSLMVMDEFADSLDKWGKADSAHNVRELIRDGYTESLHGAALCYPRLICVARKPVS